MISTSARSEIRYFSCVGISSHKARVLLVPIFLNNRFLSLKTVPTWTSSNAKNSLSIKSISPDSLRNAFCNRASRPEEAGG